MKKMNKQMNKNINHKMIRGLNHKMIIVILLFTLSFSITGELYRVYVDREFGFWAIRSNETNHTINYTQKTLNIKTGDTIEWENEDSAGDRVTIISDNLLWEGGKSLYGLGDLYRFTFNSSGIYKFHIEEQNRVILNASNVSNITTVYNEEEDTYETTGSENNPISFENFPFQYQMIVVSGPTVGDGTYPINYNHKIQNQSNVTNNTGRIPTTIVSQIKINPMDTVPKPQVTPKVTPKATNTPNLSKVTKLESYQEFTLFEMMKKWFLIIKGV